MQPINILRGSKLPGDLWNKQLHKIGFILRGERHQLNIAFQFIDPLELSTSKLPTKHAVPPKRIIGLPGQADGTIVCELDAASGMAELYMEFGDARINLCDELDDWGFIDSSIAADGRAGLSAVTSGVLSVFTDAIPVWAEISLVASIAATIPRKRVRLLLEIADRDPLVIETSEVVAVFLDDICGGGSSDEEARTGDSEQKDKKDDVHIMF